MKREKISDALGGIDEAYVKEAILYRKPTSRAKWAVLAACLAVVLIGAIVTIPLLRQEEPAVLTDVGGVPREYREFGSGGPSVYFEWPWIYKLPYEKYDTLSFSGRKYGPRTWGDPMDEALLGEVIGTCKAVGYGTEFEVRQITGIDPALMIAVDFDGQCYSYACNEYDPPATFGEVLDGYSLARLLEFSRFSVHENSPSSSGSFALTEDDPVWQILSACRDAEFVEGDWNDDTYYISLSSTSESLGVYKRVFYVAENGLIWTNVFDYAYTFHIGTEAAAQIIAYALEHGTEAEYESYVNRLIGTVVEIGDGYILVDDSICCADEKDGMVFKVPTTSPRISRYLEYRGLGVGSTISVSFVGDVDRSADNLVTGAYSISGGNFSADGTTWYSTGGN